MTAQPGDEPGNVVAWKDFKRPEGSRIYAKSENFRFQSGKLTICFTLSDLFSILRFYPYWTVLYCPIAIL